MERDEVLKMIDDIGTCESEADRRSMLNTMRGTVNSLFDENSNLNEQNSVLISEREDLRSVNTDLFLQLGAQKSEPDPEPTPEPEPEKLTYENLFNEKGELKL